jgi:hypothetical protein
MQMVWDIGVPRHRTRDDMPGHTSVPGTRVPKQAFLSNDPCLNPFYPGLRLPIADKGELQIDRICPVCQKPCINVFSGDGWTKRVVFCVYFRKPVLRKANPGP